MLRKGKNFFVLHQLFSLSEAALYSAGLGFRDVRMVPTLTLCDVRSSRTVSALSSEYHFSNLTRSSDSVRFAWRYSFRKIPPGRPGLRFVRRYQRDLMSTASDPSRSILVRFQMRWMPAPYLSGPGASCSATSSCASAICSFVTATSGLPPNSSSGSIICGLSPPPLIVATNF